MSELLAACIDALNPLGWTPAIVGLTYALNRIGLWGLNAACMRVARQWPSLAPPKPRELLPLSDADVAFLACNSLVEHVFLMTLWSLDLRAGSSAPIVAFYALTWLDDLGYAFAHRAMHHRWVYARVHAHHHRRREPDRGYLDAGNEHPLEQVVALLIHLSAIRAVHATLGVSRLVAWSHVMLKAAGACFNHTDRAVRIPLGLGVRIDVAHHRTHHRCGRCNYSQHTPAIDALFGWQPPPNQIYDAEVDNSRRPRREE